MFFCDLVVLICGVKKILSVLDAALTLLPRSGELWAEKGRFHARRGEWNLADSCFQNGVIYTPQFGDVFIEIMRAKLLRCLASRFGLKANRREISQSEVRLVVETVWNTSNEESLCVLSQPNHGFVYDEVLKSLRKHGNLSSLYVLAKAKMDMVESVLEDRDETFVDILFA